MQAVQYELFPKSREEQEQETFLSILHHDAMKRGGFFTRLDLKAIDENNIDAKQKWSTKTPYSLMTLDDSYNRYIALNTFHNRREECVIVVNGQEQKVTKAVHRRQTEYLHAITSVYLDLDWHDGTQDEINERVRNTKEFLNAAFKEGTLARPTMVTQTGRGLGIFYVLSSSIANVSGTKKQINFWKYICNEFANKYKELLAESEKPQLGIDTTVVGEVTRVVRLPGTKNLKTNTVCRLISVAKNADGSPLYYTLNDLIQYVENYNVYEKPHEEIKKKIVRKNIINFNAYTKPYLMERLAKLERAQELVFKNRGASKRELLCFFYYNTAKQIMDEQEAREKLFEFHNGFKYPLESTAELENIILSVNKAKNVRTGELQGYYEYTDAKILEKLELTEAQNEYVGFGSSLKSLARRRRKEENQKARKERNERIVAYVIEHPEATYEEIAGLFGVSVRTLKGILKKEGVSRYQKQDVETPVCAAPETAEEDSENDIINIEDYKSAQKTGGNSARLSKVQKNALVSNCVVIPGNNSTYISQTNTSKSIHTRGISVYTDKEIRRIRGMDLLEDGWELCDCSAIFDD